MDRLAEMLDLQQKLQLETYGVDPFAITMSGDMSFVKDMVLAATDELHEVLNEVSWKPWTHGERHVNVHNYKKEVVDLFHFFMNLMLAVGMTPDELYEMYVTKRTVNERRQRDGYDGVSTKCVHCKRALEDVTLSEVKDTVGSRTTNIFCQCGTEVDLEVGLRFIAD
jgi:dimeric dUTPase (all-alpha-NTP-PPase superfamily)